MSWQVHAEVLPDLTGSATLLHPRGPLRPSNCRFHFFLQNLVSVGISEWISQEYQRPTYCSSSTFSSDFGVARRQLPTGDHTAPKYLFRKSICDCSREDEVGSFCHLRYPKYKKISFPPFPSWGAGNLQTLTPEPCRLERLCCKAGAWHDLLRCVCLGCGGAEKGKLSVPETLESVCWREYEQCLYFSFRVWVFLSGSWFLPRSFCVLEMIQRGAPLSLFAIFLSFHDNKTKPQMVLHWNNKKYFYLHHTSESAGWSKWKPAGYSYYSYSY